VAPPRPPGRGSPGVRRRLRDVNATLYRLKKDPAFRARFREDPRRALASLDLTAEEVEAFARWDTGRLNELGGSLHLLLSVPGAGGH
jgi:Aromatic-ring-opening dioxygenase LigAB, LigA subunit